MMRLGPGCRNICTVTELSGSGLNSLTIFLTAEGQRVFWKKENVYFEPGL